MFTSIRLQKTIMTSKAGDSSSGSKVLQFPETNLTVKNSPFCIYSKDIARFSFYQLFYLHTTSGTACSPSYETHVEASGCQKPLLWAGANLAGM